MNFQRKFEEQAEHIAQLENRMMTLELTNEFLLFLHDNQEEDPAWELAEKLYDMITTLPQFEGKISVHEIFNHPHIVVAFPSET